MTSPSSVTGLPTRMSTLPAMIQAADSVRYVQGQVIGSGGAGAVYAGWDQQLRRHVAIKRLPQNLETSEFSRQEFLREVHFLSALSHPNILCIHDICQDQHGLFMVTEYLRGKNLREVVQSEPLTEPQFLTLVYQSLCALASSHQKNIIHNDIKPENIIVWEDGAGQWQTKLLDFGCARPKGEVPTTAEGHVLGSIFYVSPETVQGEKPDHRSDLYSLGLVFYHALTAHEPFYGETPLEIAQMRIHQDPPPLQQIRQDLSPEIINWVTHLMKRNRQDRPSSATKALQLLEQSIQNNSWLNKLLKFGRH